MTSDSSASAGTAAAPEEHRALRHYEELIGLRFRNPALLREALTHRSYVNEHPGLSVPDNQRLEFLGDAVLDLVVGEWLFRRYPDVDEGELTNIRASIVRTETLASYASEVSIGRHLLLGKGEEGSGGHGRAANLCAGFEALVGAVYLDGGLEAARSWVHHVMEAHSAEIDLHARSRDAKTRLQELVQGVRRVTPSYRIIREAGPDHAKVFTAQALVDDEVWGHGEGTTKQAAEQEAARDALLSHQDLAAPGT